MHTETYVIPRKSRDEVTVAVVRVQFTAKACADGFTAVSSVKEKIIEAVTHWVKITDYGKAAWESNNHDFNIGDLCNEKLKPFNDYLKRYGILILEIETHSMDASGNIWSFDDVLVKE